MSGGEFGVRGYITAYNIADGSQAWRWYNTGPDAEVGITDRFNPFYDNLKGEDLGVTTWPKDQWKIGGSSVWGWFSYDPELNLVYYGTSNPGTWNASIRRNGQENLGGDQLKWANKWSASVMARDLDTGELVWAYQFTPHDEWDYDGINEMVLADLETGLPVRNPEKSTKMGVNTTDICPSAMGYKDQQPISFSPETGLFYVPSNNLCMDYEGTEATYIAGVPYVGATVKTYNGPGGHGGSVFAWDPVAGEKVWENKEQFAAWAGTLNTSSGLVFHGTLDGFFKVLNAETGEVLYQYKAGSGIIGNPITYIGPDGRQYVAVLAGVGGWSGLTVAGDLSLDDPTAALGAVNAFADLGRYTQKGGQLYVFALPEGAGQASN